jgi:hypothetical protein
MATLTPREMKDLDCFSQRCWAVQRRPEQVHRWIVARHCTIKFAWVVSLATLFAFLSFLASILN